MNQDRDFCANIASDLVRFFNFAPGEDNRRAFRAEESISGPSVSFTASGQSGHVNLNIDIPVQLLNEVVNSRVNNMNGCQQEIQSAQNHNFHQPLLSDESSRTSNTDLAKLKNLMIEGSFYQNM